MREKTSPGQLVATSPIADSAFQNRLIDLVNADDRGQRPPPSGQFDTAAGLVKIKNNSGSDRLRGAVLQLDTRAFSSIDFRNQWCSAITVAYPACSRYAVLLEPIQSGKYGWAQVSGVCLARMNVVNVAHRWAHPTESAWVLKSAGCGPIEILWSESGGSEYAIVNLNVTSEDHYAVAAEDITARVGATAGFGDVTFYKMSDTGVLSSLSYTELAYNWTGATIEQDSLLRVKRQINGLLEVIGQDCSGVAL